MAESPLIPEEYRNKVSAVWEAGIYEIEKGAVARFARAIGDPNPLWQEMTPPTLITTVGGERFGELIAPMFPRGLLHGSTDLENYLPVKSGDSIAVSVKLANIRERQKTAFVVFEITYTNQRQETVARCRQTMIGYDAERPDV